MSNPQPTIRQLRAYSTPKSDAIMSCGIQKLIHDGASALVALSSLGIVYGTFAVYLVRTYVS